MSRQAAKAHGRPGKADASQNADAATVSSLPMEIQIGDRFIDHDFEWEIVTQPEVLDGAMSLRARIQRRQHSHAPPMATRVVSRSGWPWSSWPDRTRPGGPGYGEPMAGRAFVDDVVPEVWPEVRPVPSRLLGMRRQDRAGRLAELMPSTVPA
jgi:hypothetical protein